MDVYSDSRRLKEYANGSLASGTGVGRRCYSTSDLRSTGSPSATSGVKKRPPSDISGVKKSRKTSVYMEEEKPVVPGLTVRAATVEQLVQLCVDSFNVDGDIVGDLELPRVLFLMHKWFMSSEQLAHVFIRLYQDAESKGGCSQPTCPHKSQDNGCIVLVFKAKLTHALRYWIRNFPVHFDLDTKLSSAIQNFGAIMSGEGNNRLRELIDLSKVPSYDWMRNMSVRPSATRHRKVSLVFNHLEADQLAEQLTCLEYKAFRRITFLDFKHYAVHASLKDNPRLERSIALFNGLSRWIQCMVLSKTTPQQRADVMEKFVNVAKRLHSLQNFNTLMAVIGGLTHSCLARLTKTNACLTSDAQKMMTDFTELLSSNNNFSNYRRAQQNCTGFRIPILGVHLKDTISLHTALSDFVEDKLVNFRKMAQLSVIMKELTHLQNESLPVESNMDLINTIKLSLDLHYTEDEIYELSLAREPRSSLTSPSTPTKLAVFADWVSGFSPPDHETINKHVHHMVEAVFMNYDHDRDGFISHAEFDSIAGNFPFIDSFCVLDADQDGMISKAEMKTYFIRANCHALRNSFKHAFHEITYFKPTFCIHCTGLLWGLIKQGWKCKDCGINAHKHCKDLVVMECRSKIGTPNNGRRQDTLQNDSPAPINDVTFASKRRMSKRQQQTKASQSTQTDDNVFHMTVLSSPPLKRIEYNKNDNKNDNNKVDQLTRTYQSLERSVLLRHRLSPSISPSSSRSQSPVMLERVPEQSEGEFYEEQSLVFDDLVKSEQTREKLIEENKKLRLKLDNANDQILTLKAHIGLIRQHTINFILNQMDTLHAQRDTEL